MAKSSRTESHIIDLAGPFVDMLGDELADLKKSAPSQLDPDIIRLKRSMFAERFDDLKTKLVAASKMEQGRVAADLAARGLSNSSNSSAFERAIHQDVNAQLIVARREYNRAKEELAILEHRVSATTSAGTTMEKATFITQATQRGRRLFSTDRGTATSHYKDWEQFVADWLLREYPAMGYAAEWSALGGYAAATDNETFWASFRIAVERRLKWLGDFASRPLETSRPAMDRTRSTSTTVFVVHGRNEGVKQAVARFLEKLNLTAIILHEQPNQGRTLIEKLEHNSDVGFAVVLLTGDDLGGLKGSDPGTFQLRARQNVILELGLFVGLLGRGKVCALCEPGLELPSDYSGVAWTELDERGAWRTELAREISAAGIPLDATALIQPS